MTAPVGKPPGGGLVLELSKAIYEKEAVLAALYALSDRCRNRLEPVSGDKVRVTLEPLEPLDEKGLKDLEHRFLSELTDHQYRLELERRFGDLRRLILRHAFSPLENLSEEVRKALGRP